MPFQRIYMIQLHGRPAPRKDYPTPGRWYFGVNADGTVGALAQWDGFAFVSSLSDDHDMSQYHHLQERPPRG